MFSRFAIIATLLAAFTCSASSILATEILAKDIKWTTDLQEARKASLQTGRPMLIVFGADWCTFCKKLEKTTLSHPQMVNYINQRFIPVHLDHDKEKRVAQILEVESLPCSVILSPEADLLGKVKGYMTPGKYYQELSSAEKLQERIRQASNTTGAAR